MDIRRFGPGHRRPDGPPGTQGLTGQVIWSDDRGHISELAFSRHGLIAPHANPNLTLFIVISGGGYIQVGDERSRVNHGEAVVWPPGLVHGAYTDGTEMRAIIVELIDAGPPTEISGAAKLDELDADTDAEGDAEPPPSRPAPTPADGTLEDRKINRSEYDSSEGEPW